MMVFKEFFQKYKTLILLLIVVTLQFIPNDAYWPWGGIWMRLQPQDLPFLDNLAKNTVYNTYQTKFANSFLQEHKHLPAQEQQQLFNEQFPIFIQQNQPEIQQGITQTSEFLKDFLRYEENGVKYTFMPDIDPYQYLRLARNYIRYGALGDDVRNDVSWDTKVLAPLGRDSHWDKELQPYALAYLYKIISIFKPNIPIMQATAYFPIVFVTLSIIFAFLFVQKLTTPLGGFFAATMLAVHSTAVARTLWGHADTDAYNLFFPMLTTWLFIQTLESEKPTLRYGFALLTAFTLALYAFAWGGWWYIFYFMLIALCIQLIYTALFNRKKFLETLLTFSTLFFGTILFAIPFKKNIEGLIMDIFGPLGFTTLKAASHPDLLPNVYTTVAELVPASLPKILDEIGGTLFLIIAVIGITLLLFKKEIRLRNRLSYATFFALWFVATIYATTKGIRFAILITPAFAALFGITAGMIEQRLQTFNAAKLHFSQLLITILVFVFFTMIIIKSGEIEHAYATAIQDMPQMNTAWWNALIAIRDNSAPNAIITSWWDFGHHFKYVAERAVTFDGAHQNSPMAHWVGKALTTSNEEEAIALLKMLNCGSRTAYDLILQQKNNDTLATIKILNHLLTIKNKDQAKKYLTTQHISNQDRILTTTHCEPPESFFITSEDMVQKAGVWGHFGLWNFEKAYAWNNLRNKDQHTAINDMLTTLNSTPQYAEQMYLELISLTDENDVNSWISPWPGYNNIDTCERQNITITCNNGVVITTTTFDTQLHVEQGIARPRYLSYLDEKTKQFVVKEFRESPSDIAVILIPTGDSHYRVILAAPEHAASMFTRLFFFQGHGLKYFKQFNRYHQLIGSGEIIVWKIDWKGTQQNIHDTL